MPKSSLVEYISDPVQQRASDSDEFMLLRAETIALRYEPVGSYSMIALWRKGSRWHTGQNNITRPAMTLSDVYPEYTGVHAELSLVHVAGRHSLRRGVVAVGGVLSSGNHMTDTMPCVYCAEILDACGVRRVVYRCDDEPVWSTPADICRL